MVAECPGQVIAYCKTSLAETFTPQEGRTGDHSKKPWRHVSLIASDQSTDFAASSSPCYEQSDIRIELDLAREARDLEILPKRAQRDLSKAVT
jgi:hypothetical protein